LGGGELALQTPRLGPEIDAVSTGSRRSLRRIRLVIFIAAASCCCN